MTDVLVVMQFVGIVVGVYGGVCVVVDQVEYREYRWVDDQCIVECCGGSQMVFVPPYEQVVGVGEDDEVITTSIKDTSCLSL